MLLQPGSGWRALLRKNGTPEFSAAFSREVCFEASVMTRPCVGVACVSAVLSASSAMYDRLVFTRETVGGPVTYLEWEGQAFGSDVAGTTVFARDYSGLIERVCLYHRPLQMVMRLSAELARRLEGKVDRSLFQP